MRRHLEHLVAEFEENMDADSAEIISTERYAYIEKIMAQVSQKTPAAQAKNITAQIDRIILNKYLALPIFIAAMFLIYYIAVSSLGALCTDFMNDKVFGEWVPAFTSAGLEALHTPAWLSELILDGIIGGVGAVLGFVPQIMILFLLLSFLEDSGYMSRIAFILDAIFRRLGLSGKSIIPIMIGTGCGVPGIMAARTIENESDRKITIITTTFIPCSAKLPIIALISSVFFNHAWWVAGSAYFLGIIAIVVSAVSLKKMRLFAKDVSPFVMELPAYHLPSAKSLLIHMWEKGKAFIKKAGTIILASCIIIWFISSFDFRLNMVPANQSILAEIGHYISIVFQPLGFGDWRAVSASITGLLAKENLVGTMATLYADMTSAGFSYADVLKSVYTPLAAYSLLVFNLLCAPCFAAVGAIFKEMGQARWAFFAIAYQTLFAYSCALVVYQLGLAISGLGFTVFTAVAILIVFWTVYRLLKRQSKAGLDFGVHVHE
jgi:ferrous iron transport protein B